MFSKCGPIVIGLVSHLREFMADALNFFYYREAISLSTGIVEEVTQWRLAAIYAADLVGLSRSS